MQLSRQRLILEEGAGADGIREEQRRRRSLIHPMDRGTPNVFLGLGKVGKIWTGE